MRLYCTMNRKGISCEFCGASRNNIICSVTGPLRNRLSEARTNHRYESGNVLFYEGAAPLAVYCIHRGLVKLTKSAPNGKSIVIRLLGRGEIAGFRAVIANEPYAAGAEVVEPSDICIIPAETFKLMLEQSASMKSALIEKLAIELRISEDRMLDQTMLPGRVRVARLLLFLAGEVAASSERPVIQTKLLRQDLAEAVGITPPTFSRILHQFNVAGVIRSTRSLIMLTDTAQLKKISETDS